MAIREAQMATVLVIDDDRALTRAICVRLQGAGYDVLVTHDAASGSRLAVSARPDAILLDFDLPSCSGLELHECLRFAERSRHIPVVYLSSCDSVTKRVAAFRNGASAFLSKPYNAAELLNVLEMAILAATKRSESAEKTVEPQITN